MKPLLLIVCSSLLLITAGLELKQSLNSANNYSLYNIASTPALLRPFWFKKARKEALRDDFHINPLRKAIDNSLHFILAGLSSNPLPFSDK